MLHSHVRLYVHIVWSTKNREPYLISSVREKVKEHLSQNAKDKEIEIQCINVQIDHVHILINLRSDQKVDDIVKLLKGESSHWINSEDIIKNKFVWQRGYGAFSVSQSRVEDVKNYIMGQDEHHRKKTFFEEYKAILEKYGFDRMEIDES